MLRCPPRSQRPRHNAAEDAAASKAPEGLSLPPGEAFLLAPLRLAPAYFLLRGLKQRASIASGMPTTIAVVGAGRVGRSLGRALRNRGLRLGAVVTTNLRSSRAAVRFVGAGKPLARIEKGVAEGDIVLISTPDRAVAEVARALARLPVRWHGKAVLHTSGALSSRELLPLRRRGAAVGCLHPLYPFPHALKTLPRGIVFGVEGDRRACAMAARLARKLGGTVVRVQAKRKTHYHAAAVMAAGHLLTLLELASSVLARAGVRGRDARRALLPLAEATLQAYSRCGARAWTGPIKRGDAETVWRHLVALKEMPLDVQQVYVSLARAGLHSLGALRGRSERELRRLLER